MNEIYTDPGLLRKVIRSYTFNTPFRRGVYRMALAGLRLGGALPERLLITADDGRKLVVNPADEGYKFLYFTGQYEPAITSFVRKAILEGDVCVDMGANLGWYTTLMMDLAGPSGAVHAFEPMPATFTMLDKNVALNRSIKEVYINECAVGDRIGDVEMFLGHGMPEGHATFALKDSEAGERAVSPVVTLDYYLDDKGVGEVMFVKADIEGAELAALKGSNRLFEQDIPPIFVIEMALATSKRFGYRPQDLILFLNGKRDYSYFEIDERTAQLTQIEEFESDSLGANVLCVPAECEAKRRAMLGID